MTKFCAGDIYFSLVKIFITDFLLTVIFSKIIILQISTDYSIQQETTLALANWWCPGTISESDRFLFKMESFCTGVVFKKCEENSKNGGKSLQTPNVIFPNSPFRSFVFIAFYVLPIDQK